MNGLPRRADRMVVMGVINVTPDSFSDGGRWSHCEHAIAQGLAMHAAGADLIDVGGESTRPGAERVDADEQLRRVLPVIRGLARHGVPISVDTYHAHVAAAALDAGARIVNDVSGGLGDPRMASVIGAAGCPWILMHWRGHSAAMQQLARYDDVVVEVRDELSRQVEAAVRAGVATDRLVIDPGLGFAKTAAHNWALLAALDSLVGLGLPVLVGASRKTFLGSLLGAGSSSSATDRGVRPVDRREDATTAITTYCALNRAWAVRVHEVGPAIDAALTAAAILGAAARRRG